MDKFKQEISNFSETELDFQKYLSSCDAEQLKELYEHVPLSVTSIRFKAPRGTVDDQAKVFKNIQNSFNSLPRHINKIIIDGFSFITGDYAAVEFSKLIPKWIDTLDFHDAIMIYRKPLTDVHADNIKNVFIPLTQIENLTIDCGNQLAGVEKLILHNLPGNINVLKLDYLLFNVYPKESYPVLFSKLRCKKLILEIANFHEIEDLKAILGSLKTSLVEEIEISAPVWNNDAKQLLTFLPKTVKKITLHTEDNEILTKETDIDNTTRLKTVFMENHKQQLNLDRSIYGYFLGLFRRTNVTPAMSLSDIATHARGNNRSHQVFMDLGWMNDKGEIINEELKSYLVQPEQNGYSILS